MKEKWIDKVWGFIGIFVFLWGFTVRMACNSNLGHILVMGTGVVLAARGWAGAWMRRCIPAWIRNMVCILAVMGMGLAAFLFAYGAVDTADGREDAAIILGAGLREDDVTLTLAQRLDTAIAYAQANSQACLVVSGGQGKDEVIQEAQVMARYLVEHGVDESRILLEEKSTSTRENFRFSKALLDAKFPQGYRAVCITNGFHAYRAQRIAAQEGLAVTRVCAPVAWFMVPANALREAVAVLKLWLVDSWQG